MQWLFDIVVEMMWASIYERGIYRDRGEYPGPDFSQVTLTTDGNWHELDLSGIIEENAKAVCIRIKARTSAVPKVVRFRKHGTTITTHTCVMRTVIANMDNNNNTTIGVDTDRKIDYHFSNFVWEDISMVIRGWIM